MNRRGFLQSILAAGVAPYVVSSGVLMPVKKIWVPEVSIERIFFPGQSVFYYSNGREILRWEALPPINPFPQPIHKAVDELEQAGAKD